MSQAAIRTGIYNAVNGVTNVGKVYDRLRLTTEWSYEQFLDLFKVNIGGIEQIRGWMIEYKNFETDDSFQCFTRKHEYVINGFMRVNDERASEKEFATLVETVSDTLDADSTVHAHSDSDPAQLGVFEVRLFGNVACHYAEITQKVSEDL